MLTINFFYDCVDNHLQFYSLNNIMKTIDYLTEDPEIPQQKVALISIVGPHMPQKCDVWGIKIRGTADTLDKAKTMAQKLLKMDSDYDIFTVEVGKFFPLSVTPQDVGNVEYQNTQLNELIKSYLENRESANEHWTKRRNEMIKEAVREGRNQEEMANKPEHPIVVIQRIRNIEESIAKTNEQISAFEEDLKLAQNKLATYSEEERELAMKELQSAINNETPPSIPEQHDSNLTVDDIRDKLVKDLDVTNYGIEQPMAETSHSKMESVVNTLRKYENELEELKKVQESLSLTNTPTVYSRISDDITVLTSKIDNIKIELNNSQAVNDYINSKYDVSKYEYLNSNPHPMAVAKDV